MSGQFATFINWWRGRSQREQMLLGVLGAVALIAVLIVGVVKPLQAARGQARADIRTYQTLAIKLRAAGGQAAPAQPQRQGDPAMIVASSAQEFGLVAEGATAAGVTFADAPYEGVLRWIASIEATSDLRVASLSMTPGAAAGRVRAEVRFQP